MANLYLPGLAKYIQAEDSDQNLQQRLERSRCGRIIEQLCAVGGKSVALEGGYEAVEQLIFARYQMYQQVYFQKTKMAFELMLRKQGEILKEKNF